MKAKLLIIMLVLFPQFLFSQAIQTEWTKNAKGAIIQSGKIQQEGRIGPWIELTEDYQFLRAGEYLQTDIFTGFLQSDTSGLQYLENNLLLDKDSLFWQTQLTSEIGKSIELAGTSNLLQKHIRYYQDSLKIELLSSEAIHTLLIRLIPFQLHFRDFSLKEKELETLRFQFEEMKIAYPGFKKQFLELENAIQSIETDSVLPSRLEKYQLAGNQLESIKNSIGQVSKKISEANGVYQETEKTYKQIIPENADKELVNWKIRLDQLQTATPDSVSIKADLLIKDCQILIRQLQDYESVKTDTKKNTDKLREYAKTETMAVYQQSIAPFIQRTETVVIQSPLKMKEEWQKLLAESTDLAGKMDYLDKTGKSVSEEIKNTSNKYLQLYPPIYKKELKPLLDKLIEVEKMTDLNGKYSKIHELQDTLTYYQGCSVSFQSLDSLIDGQMMLFKEKLNTEDRVIYKMNIPAIEAQIKNYRMADLSASKLIMADDLRKRYQTLLESYAGLLTQKAQIDSLLPIVSNRYLQSFPPIYKSEISLLEAKKEEYTKIPQLDLRFNAGKDLLSELSRYDTLHNFILTQNSLLINKISETEVNYTPLFPRIVKEELDEVKKDYKIYEHLDFTDKKLLKGQYMTDQLDTMMSCIRELERNDGRIKTEFPTLMLRFKTDYPLVYKLTIQPLEIIIDEYEKSGYHQRKLTLSRTLIQSLDENLKKLEKISNQQSGIKRSYEEFDTYFQSKNQEKNLYKRTKNIYEELFAEYEKEADIQLKTEKGDLILKILTKINDMRGKDNTKFNEEIKEAKDRLKYFEIISRF